jgi:hypothetical protein
MPMVVQGMGRLGLRKAKCRFGYSQLSVVPSWVNGFTPRVGRRW